VPCPARVRSREAATNQSSIVNFLIVDEWISANDLVEAGGLPFQGGAARGFLLSAQDGTAFLEAGGELLEEFVFHGDSPGWADDADHHAFGKILVGVERGHQACWLRRMASSIS